MPPPPPSHFRERGGRGGGLFRSHPLTLTFKTPVLRGGGGWRYSHGPAPPKRLSLSPKSYDGVHCSTHRLNRKTIVVFARVASWGRDDAVRHYTTRVQSPCQRPRAHSPCA